MIAATFAWLIIITSADPTHRSVNAFRYGSMSECLSALQGTQIRLHRDGLKQARLIGTPKCTDTKPTWWRE